MLKRNEWEKINDLTASLHGIQNLKAMRQTFLGKLSQLIDFDFSDFSLGSISSNKGRSFLVDPVVVSTLPHAIEEKFIHLYEEQYRDLDYVSWIFSHHQSIAYKESDLIDPKLRLETDFYKEYLSKFDLGLVAGLSIISSGRFVGAVTLYKSESKKDFSARDLYILNQLLPHLQIRLASSEEAAIKNKQQLYNMLIYNYHLTKKEVDVIGQIKEGLTNQEIANTNFTSINTTKNHIAHIYEKFGVKSRTKLLEYLSKAKLIDYWN